MRVSVVGENNLIFFCPGCGHRHSIPVSTNVMTKETWLWNGKYLTPTIAPSIKVEGTVPLSDAEYYSVMAGEITEPKPFLCHSLIKKGDIQFYDDCTHKLAGQTVPLPHLD